MAREFEAKVDDKEKTEKEKITLRDFIALLMPIPPWKYTEHTDDTERFMDAMKARYAMADRIIKEVR